MKNQRNKKANANDVNERRLSIIANDKGIITTENLKIKVSYTVGLSDVQMPEEVYLQLLDAAENLKELDVTGGSRENQEAAEWIIDNIKEKYCFDWSAEVVKISNYQVPDA